MPDPVALRVVDKDNKPNEAVVDALKHLLAIAERGELTAFAYATVRRDGSFQTWWSTGKDMNFALHTGIARLNWRYHAEAFSEEQSDHNPESEK